VLIICQEIPHLGSYSTTSVLRSLLNNILIPNVHIIGFKDLKPKVHAKNELNLNYSFNAITIFSKTGERYFRFALIPLLVILGIFNIIFRRHKSILVVFPDDISLLSAYIIHKITGKPLFPYFMDLYKETGVWLKPLDSWLQKRIFSSSTKVLVVNEAMKNYYEEKYNIICECVPFVLPFKPFKPKSYNNSFKENFTIAYSGTINGVRLEGLKILKEVVLQMEKVSIVFFTPQPKDTLIQLGIWDEKFSIYNISDVGVLVEELGKCNVLFNPVYAGVIDLHQTKTSFGGKIVEYLASGSPIIIDSDPDFFTYKLFNQLKAGILVKHKTPEHLFDCIQKLINDSDYYNTSSQSSKEMIDYFNPIRVKSIFDATFEKYI
jgi:hypothetical protein